jgi:hypothetical protein
MHFRKIISLGVGVLYIICLNTLALGQSSKYDLDVRFGDPQKSYRVQGVAASTSMNGIFVGGYYSVSGSKERQRTTWLWEVNSSGEKVLEFDVASIWNKLALDFGFSDVALLSTNIIFATQSRNGEPMLISITTNGNLRYSLPLANKYTGTVITKIVVGTESTFFLLGHRMRSAVVYKLDSSGNVLWEQSLDNKRMDHYVDGLATSDGGLVAVRNSSEQALPLGGCDLSIEHFDVNGRFKTMYSFPGRDGSLIRTISGKLILVYKEAPKESIRSTEGLNINAVEFSLDMVPLWTNTVAKIFRPFDTFSIYNVNTSNLIVGSTNLFTMWAATISEQGDVRKVVQGDNNENPMGDKFRIMSNNHGTYVVFSALAENEAHKEANKVAIMKFKSEALTK